MNLALSEVKNGTFFTGNPKYPCIELPLYSASTGNGLYLKIVDGIFGFPKGCFWPHMTGYIVEDYKEKTLLAATFSVYWAYLKIEIRKLL
jgi:hypothetical protein